MKTKTKPQAFTPGPWKYEGAKDRRTHARLIWGPEGIAADAVATAEDFNEFARDGEVEANARLIASAPLLLAALEDLVSRCDGPEGVRADGSNIQTIQAHAALTAARGEAK